jgi:hypothetical protein
MKRKRRFTLYYCLFALSLTAALLVAARLSMAFAEWYALNIFPVFPHTLGRLFSPLPFSAFELLLTLTGAGLAALFGYFLLLLAGGKKARLLERWRIWGSRLAIACCSLLLMYTLTCGINYSRAPLAYGLGLDPQPSSARELRRLFTLLCQETSIEAAQIPTDGQGCFVLPQEPREEARAAMKRLGGAYAPLDSYYPQPKPVLFSRGLSYLHIAGIYSPFTLEANYNRAMPPGDKPFSICHELAHLCGYAREDEANFIAYLACLGSGNSDLRYSGLLTALNYVLNALYAGLPLAEYRELYQELPEQAQRDLQQNAAYWQAFAGPAAEFSRHVNDVYLKANDQPEGVQSYGRMVDLLLAYYAEVRE